MDGKQAAIVVRKHFEDASEMCPCLGFQTYSITRVDAGYDVVCSVCPTIFGYGGRYRALVDHDGKLDRLERVDMRPELTDVDVVPDSIIIGNLRRTNTRQHKQIYDQYDTIGGLRATIRELEERDALKTTAIDELQKTIGKMKSKVEPPNLAVMALLHNLNVKIEALEAELSARKEDSKVLMQVVEAIRDNSPIWWTLVVDIVEDYLDVPEIPDREETSVITDQAIDEALDTIVSGMFNETAGAMQTAIAHQDRRIEYLDARIDKKSVFISSLLRNDKRLNRLLDGRRADVSDRDKIIESLRVDVADRDRHIDELENRVGVLPENFWVVVGQLRDANRQQTTAINGLEETLKLERIDHTAEVSAITNTLHDTIKALRTDVSDRDRRIEESGAVIAKLRIERNRLTHNLHVREGKP